MSSKDWPKMKEKMIEESKKAEEEYIKKKEEENKHKSAEELAQEKADEEAEKIKRQILPTRVQEQDEDAFGFCNSEEGEEEVLPPKQAVGGNIS